jgi:hypothetical protein
MVMVSAWLTRRDLTVLSVNWNVSITGKDGLREVAISVRRFSGYLALRALIHVTSRRATANGAKHIMFGTLPCGYLSGSLKCATEIADSIGRPRAMRRGSAEYKPSNSEMAARPSKTGELTKRPVPFRSRELCYRRGACNLAHF